MEKLHTHTLIGQLQVTLRTQLKRLQELRDMPEHLLVTRPGPKRWSIVEICGHINLSSGHYFKILRALYADRDNGLRLKEYFQPGRFGEMGVKAMAPTDDGRINWKMRTLGIFEPRDAASRSTAPMDELRSMLEGFIELLELARTRGIEGERVTSTLGPILRFKTGDAFRFPIAHQERHFLQMARALQELMRREEGMGTDRRSSAVLR